MRQQDFKSFPQDLMNSNVSISSAYSDISGTSAWRDYKPPPSSAHSQVTNAIVKPGSLASGNYFMPAKNPSNQQPPTII